MILLLLHTQHRFTAPLGFCPGLPRWADITKVKKHTTRKVKPIWIYWSKRQWWQWHQLGHMQICTLTQTHIHISIPPLVFHKVLKAQYDTNTTLQQSFYGPLSGTAQVSQYQKKQSPTHTYPDHQSSFISFLHLLRSIASSLFTLRAWQSFCTTSLQILFGLPLGLAPSTSYSTHFFTQSLSCFGNTYPYHCNLFCCSTDIMSSDRSLSLNSLLGTLLYHNITHPSDHSHLCSLKCQYDTAWQNYIY